MAANPRVRFLATDIFDMPDAEDGKRYEVIEGELVMSPAPSLSHQRPLMRLSRILMNWAYVQQVGEVFLAPFGVILDESNGVEPDLIYVSKEKDAIVKERGIEGSPDLLLEVLSPSTRGRDRGVKMRAYAACRVPHYWIVDPIAHAIEAYQLGDAGYELEARAAMGDIFRPELFPGLEIPIDEIWS